MFEKFNIDDLYFCTVLDSVPFAINNFGGFVSIEGSCGIAYETVVYCCGNKYIDINHMDRIINVIHYPERNIPMISENHHLYSICEETLVPYRERIETKMNVLRRLPFGLNIRY